MNAKRFAKDGQTTWESNGTFSGAIETINQSVDLTTGFAREEKNLMWIKGNSEEIVSKQIEALIKSINNGQLATVRVFSKNPFYKDQPQDINPSTGEQLGRYSQVRLCPSSKYNELNRSYVENEVAVNADAVEAAA